MPIGTQAKLLRVLEDRKLRRLGSKVETTVDVRVLAATNKAPEEAVARGELRNDLYYRLNVFNIHMPPLREHKEDLPDLVHALLADMNEKHGRKVAALSEAVLNRVSELLLAGECSRVAEYVRAGGHRLRRRGSSKPSICRRVSVRRPSALQCKIRTRSIWVWAPRWGRRRSC